MASSVKTKSGKWSCRVYIGLKDGKRVYKRITANTRKEAEKLAAEYANNNPLKIELSNIKVKEAVTSYIESKSAVLSPSTVAGYKKIARIYLQSIMDVRLSDLSTNAIQVAVNKDASAHSPKTVRNALGLITAALSMFGYRVEQITLPQKVKKEIVIPTDEEMKLLSEKSFDYGIPVEVHLAAFMGMRRSEIAAITPEDIDLDAKKLSVRKAKVKSPSGKYVVKGTKTTSSTRTLAIPANVIPLLFDVVKGKKTIHLPDYIEKKFVEMRNDLNLKHITFHSLRHYFASALVVLDIPDFYAMKMMGHSSDQMLKRVYQHVRQDYLDSASEKMNEFISKKISNDD